jgi:raffinose/stachyose/melibiose transport system permease protein
MSVVYMNKIKKLFVIISLSLIGFSCKKAEEKNKIIVFQGAHFVNYPLLMSGVIITILPVIIVYVFMQRYIISGIIQSAL